MIFIKRNTVPEAFKSSEIESLNNIVSSFFERPYDDRIQEKFKFPPFPDSLKIEVEKQFKKKCAYCESKLDVFSPSYIDNYRPKRGARGFEKNEFYDDHYWWLVYVWANLYLSCPECNKHKGSWFPIQGDLVKAKEYGLELINEKPLLLDPCYDQPAEHFLFDRSGVIEPITERGRVTVEILKLNRASLVKSRKDESNKLHITLKKILEKLDAEIIKDDTTLKPVLSLYKDFESLMSLLSDHPDTSFVGLKRQFFFNWIIKNPEIYDLIKFYRKDILSFNDLQKLFFQLGWLRKETKKLDFSENDYSKLDTIERIEIKNFRTIISMNVDLSSSKSDRTSWLLFLGENGLGKSSILQAIAYTLVDKNYRKHLTLNDILKKGKQSGFIKIFLVGRKRPIELVFDKKSISIKNEGFGSYILGYGATRLLPQKGIFSEDNHHNTRVLNLFQPTIALHDASVWLYNLDEKRFDYMSRALKEILYPQNIDRIEKGKKINTISIYHENRNDTLNEMSEGYKSVVALAVDIMQILDRDGTTMEEAQGIVFIDEIGSHLHPRWKMRIVDCFRKAFPKVQFIVTTHEPLCLRGMEEGEVVVLKRDYESREVEVINDLPSPSGFRVDQLLTSEFFGLHSTSDPIVEAEFNKYYKLLALSKMSNQQSVDLIKIKEQLKDKKYFGNTLREELMYSVIDQLLAREYNNEKAIDKNQLKKETVAKVKELWKEIGFIE